MKRNARNLFALLSGIFLTGTAFGESANTRSSGSVYSVGTRTGFGSVGQSLSTQPFSLPSKTSYGGLIHVLFGFPRNSGADSDGDGMSDWYEDFFGLGKNDPDDASEHSDGDGFTNLEEFLAGTDPFDSDNFLQMSQSAALGNGSQRLTWQGEIGRRYQVYATDDLMTDPGAWLLVGSPLLGQGGELLFDTPAGNDAQIFYLIKAEYISD